VKGRGQIMKGIDSFCFSYYKYSGFPALLFGSLPLQIS
jgi:hypothetical protein